MPHFELSEFAKIIEGYGGPLGLDTNKPKKRIKKISFSSRKFYALSGVILFCCDLMMIHWEVKGKEKKVIRSPEFIKFVMLEYEKRFFLHKIYLTKIELKCLLFMSLIREKSI
ncbi:hypothetical protein BpHYR1_028572 [Brachionus plicatilis]|uniref:Uncharacterized protein n=1 Tax=Brachionus plicatilis TaxID=10195 RepID=A0A3M7QSJ3_BRAPC|nr:hypothetical protein BpHYR1_028572 [Brachionus plicatilis]